MFTKPEVNSSHTKLYELINAGELESYHDGPHRKITMRSIYARIERKLRESQKLSTA